MTGMLGRSAPFFHLSDGDQHNTSYKHRPHSLEDQLRAKAMRGQPRTSGGVAAARNGRRPSKGAIVDEQLLQEDEEMLRRKEEGRKAKLEGNNGRNSA